MWICSLLQPIYSANKSLSVAALSRLLEAVAKSIRHSVAMSTILATELLQARCDAAIAISKLLLENSSYKLWNAPINARSLLCPHHFQCGVEGHIVSLLSVLYVTQMVSVRYLLKGLVYWIEILYTGI